MPAIDESTALKQYANHLSRSVLHAAQAGRLFIAAERVQMTAEDGPAQHHPGARASTANSTAGIQTDVARYRNRSS